MIRPTQRLQAVVRGRTRLTTTLGCGLVMACLAIPLLAPASRAQGEPPKAVEPPLSAFNVAAVQSLLARGDAAAARGDLSEARRFFDEARDASRRLLGFYRDLSGSFRGLDARIPREMDAKGRETLDQLAQANMRLAALFRRQGQPEVAVPLLVEVVRTMTPTTDFGRQAYQQLIEIGFVTTPYTAPSGTAGS